MLKKFFRRKEKKKVEVISIETIQKSIEKNKMFEECYFLFRKKKKSTELTEEIFLAVKELYDNNFCDVASYPFPIDSFELPAKDGTINWSSNVMGWKKIISPYVRLVLAYKGIFIPTLEEMNEDK